MNEYLLKEQNIHLCVSVCVCLLEYHVIISSHSFLVLALLQANRTVLNLVLFHINLNIFIFCFVHFLYCICMILFAKSEPGLIGIRIFLALFGVCRYMLEEELRAKDTWK
jgi:hypothetical protein